MEPELLTQLYSRGGIERQITDAHSAQSQLKDNWQVRSASYSCFAISSIAPITARRLGEKANARGKLGGVLVAYEVSDFLQAQAVFKQKRGRSR